MQINQKRVNTNRTHEGAPASMINTEQLLRRSIMACMLFEKEFYEDGVEIAERIASCVKLISLEKLAAIAIEAKTKQHLRHAPLWLAVCMAKEHKLKAETLTSLIMRVDELAEFLAMYWLSGKTPISKQVKKGLAAAFNKFNEYQFGKYNRDKAVKLRDVMFMVHPKPANEEQTILFKKIVDDTLAIPDTWETQLSSGKDKKGTWLRLIDENKLGGLAMLRNIRNMKEAGLSKEQITKGFEQIRTDNILPYRFIAASKFAPDMEPELEKCMLKCIEGREKIGGKTVILVDVSGSMDGAISDKSDLRRVDAACGLAIIAREVFADVRIITFSDNLIEVPLRHGFALRDAVMNSQQHGETYLGGSITKINSDIPFDRLIVITDEQSHDVVPPPKSRGYMINVASNKNGVGYGQYIKIDGWSEAVLDYIAEYEK